ncbi:coiled-coil domain-containing protein 28B-like [Oncorhynchus tshawytscha]|uniref:coiled-coil domain-containing protein 28B-like n=1 Tax=Oncorhynchus tshawytscha TaxID=74940 RepID=UPI001C3D216A|nr:coiled-coil domain-containing protein 28B-like [Oncorhynchus tshawytscha]
MSNFTVVWLLFTRPNNEKAMTPQPAGPTSKLAQYPTLQHSFFTDISDVREMEGGLLNLLNDFHSIKLQAFGKVCSFEHMREIQEKLAWLHFSLDSHVEEMLEDQRKCTSDHNLEHLLCNISTTAVHSSPHFCPYPDHSHVEPHCSQGDC